jgi:hypothetical protein
MLAFAFLPEYFHANFPRMASVKRDFSRNLSQAQLFYPYRGARLEHKSITEWIIAMIWWHGNDSYINTSFLIGIEFDTAAIYNPKSLKLCHNQGSISCCLFSIYEKSYNLYKIGFRDWLLRKWNTPS